MVKKTYKCLCGMNFGNRKDNYTSHINRLKPCVGITQNLLKITQNLLIINSVNLEIKNDENINSVNIVNLEIKDDMNINSVNLEIKNDENINSVNIVNLEIKNDENINSVNLEIKDDEIINSINTLNLESNNPVNLESNNPVNLESNNSVYLESNNENNFQCEFCQKKFNRKYNLNRHLERCKLKPENNKSFQSNDKLDLILKQNDELKKEIEKLKIKIRKTKTKTTNININQQNINVNNNILINFNELDYNNIDKKLFIQPIMNHRLFGKMIILQMIENVYINENHPEYQNLIITDKNRGYVKIYNNGKWKTDNIEMINMIIDEIISHSKNIMIELKEQYINNNCAKNRLNTSEKYIKLCDLEHLADLEDKQINEDIVSPI